MSSSIPLQRMQPWHQLATCVVRCIGLRGCCLPQASGTYISRTLSYQGAEFCICNIPVDPAFKVISDSLTSHLPSPCGPRTCKCYAEGRDPRLCCSFSGVQVMYDRATEFCRMLWTLFTEYDLLNGQGGMKGWLLFYSTQQRFFRQMLMAAKACNTCLSA